MRTVLKLLPIFIVHILVIITYSHGHPDLVQGEYRYVGDATNLIEYGRQSVRDPVPWNGPGYPLFLVPFLLLHAPDLAMRLANSVLLLLGLLYLVRALMHFVRENWAIVAAYCVGLYPVTLKYLPRIITEPICIFLACGLAYHVIRMNHTSQRRVPNIVLAGVYFGVLALAKVLFGYVIAVAIVISLAVLLASRRRTALRALLVSFVALAVCVPYLYTNYTRTGKPFYWAQSGGLSLYWMASPFEDEYGDWLTGTKAWLGGYWKAEKHQGFIEGVRDLPPVERDQALLEEGVRNILKHPGKFAKNWVANITRLFLHYPFSYKDQALKDLRSIVPGSLLMAVCILCLVPTFINWRNMPVGVREVFLVAFFYVGGNSLLSAYDRMLLPVLPMLTVWLVYVISRTVQPGWLRLRF